MYVDSIPDAGRSIEIHAILISMLGSTVTSTFTWSKSFEHKYIHLELICPLFFLQKWRSFPIRTRVIWGLQVDTNVYTVEVKDYSNYGSFQFPSPKAVSFYSENWTGFDDLHLLKLTGWNLKIPLGKGETATNHQCFGVLHVCFQGV